MYVGAYFTYLLQSDSLFSHSVTTVAALVSSSSTINLLDNDTEEQCTIQEALDKNKVSLNSTKKFLMGTVKAPHYHVI